MTTQRPEKTFPLIELFGPTIQGEGSMCGKQTFFIRLGVCDYKCTMCDSKHAVDPEQIKKNATYLTASEIAERLLEANKEYGTPWVTISGGNPCVHNLDKLVTLIQLGGMKVAVETQGTFLPTWLFKCNLVTISPKGPGMGETFNESLFEQYVDSLITPDLPYERFKRQQSGSDTFFPQTCLKIVVFDEQDFAFARHVWSYCPDASLFLSLGNKWLPEGGVHGDTHVKYLLDHYRNLAEKLYRDPVLNRARFLPQLHALVWSNEKGR